MNTNKTTQVLPKYPVIQRNGNWKGCAHEYMIQHIVNVLCVRRLPIDGTFMLVFDVYKYAWDTFFNSVL